MIPSFGPASDMKKSQQQNKSLLKKRNSLKELNDQGLSEKGKTAMRFKEATADELNDYRANLAEKQRKEKMRNRLLLLGTVTFVTILFLWILL